MSSRKKAVASIIVLLTVLVLVASVPPAKAQFVLAVWDYPDEYGQGIESFILYENSSGSWSQYGGKRYYSEANLYNWSANVAIKLRCYTWINSSLVGAADDAEAKNLQQHSVTVSNGTGTVFSQQNFTQILYYPGINPPLWYYAYEVVLNFIPDYGLTYVVTVTYEIFY